MLKSMTGFARLELESEQGVLTWELRTVNHRYLEPHLKIPDMFREAEPKLRSLMRKYLSRGKLDCSLKWQPSNRKADGLKVNAEVLAQLSEACRSVNELFDDVAPVDAISVLQWPGVIDNESGDRQQLLAQANESFEACLKILLENRQREGTQLEPLFEERLVAIENIVKEVRAWLPDILKKQSELVKKRFEEASVQMDNERLEQEMVLLAQKTDVAEELDRLDAHVVEVRSVLKKKEPVGRRLDFLMQELNREANTLSSKSIVTDTTKAAVELKVLIEQMREQVQNVE
ncbi:MULTISPECIES: YicC/YloC family endoribonuclease [unclassified Oleiphilus]|uniref:YicC/YloC family endoribonuclease n=2 Tax=Oleiphilus TaxID=141450 RepID=UPI0007C25D7C|nr:MULTISPECIES: YicC/YloC family endoribonuclease [unclassified Oleiphilus]KZY44196.1 hypothetical protein A3732_12795 [Oleiphilus sp. HI0050]KZY77624.1 hypothetical protein A3740_09900 [Oleiphilus sp. HI0068]KZY77789.1 hypothetical protein A3741_08910 [Oleiphilus sp. HI0069]KZY90570.1 hypothetical protein A3743_00710 [Oleiphilus sp. HI0072]KZZ20711.1 hypothetical protein A3752_10960 [Oleiphilus sp. HI0081]